MWQWYIITEEKAQPNVGPLRFWDIADFLLSRYILKYAHIVE